MKLKKVNILNKQNILVYFLCVGTACFFAILFYYINTLQYKKTYDNFKTYYRVLSYPDKNIQEKPIKITSEFRGDPLKTGVAPGVYHLKGHTKSLFRKINGSLHGASKATPAIDESGIYIGSDDGWFYKLNHQGELIWKTFFAKAGMGVHGTALLSQKYLWIGAYDGILYCLNKSTGELVWSIDLGDAIGASPSFYKDQIIISVELMYPRMMGYIASISTNNGQLNWKSPLTSAHPHSSVAIHTKKGYGVVGANNGLLFKIDLKTGQYLWTLQTKGAIRSTPLIYKDQIYINNAGNQFLAVDEKGEIVWDLDIGNPSQSSPTYIPDKSYLIFSTHKRGWLFAVSAKTGAVIWKKKITNYYAVSSGVSFFSKQEGRYLFLFPCKAKEICWIDPTNGRNLKTIPTGFLLTGSFGFFEGAFYMNLNNGGLQVLY